MPATRTDRVAPSGHPWRHLSPRAAGLVAATALVLSACGDAPTSENEPEPEQQALAPECHEVDELTAELPEGTEPTGTTAEPVDDPLVPDDQAQGQASERDGQPDTTRQAPPGMGPQIERWARQEAADSFAGVWVDQDLGGYAVAFATEVDRHADEVRDRFHPGLAVAEADHSYAELRDIQERIGREQSDVEYEESGAIRSAGVQVLKNRTTVGIFDPDQGRLAELSETYGASAICFDIEEPPGPPAEGVEPLAKASGWREGLPQGDPSALLEVAYDRETADRAWRANVPDDLDERDDDLPAEPGVYGALDEVDFDRQAVVVWSSGESGSCPGWLADLDTVDNTVHVEVDATAQLCTDDYVPYRMVLAVDRDRLPQPDQLPHARIEGVPDSEISSYPTTSADPTTYLPG